MTHFCSSGGYECCTTTTTAAITAPHTISATVAAALQLDIVHYLLEMHLSFQKLTQVCCKYSMSCQRLAHVCFKYSMSFQRLAYVCFKYSMSCQRLVQVCFKYSMTFERHSHVWSKTACHLRDWLMSVSSLMLTDVLTISDRPS
jgi:hypothetical protein